MRQLVSGYYKTREYAVLLVVSLFSALIFNIHKVLRSVHARCPLVKNCRTSSIPIQTEKMREKCHTSLQTILHARSVATNTAKKKT